MCWLNPNCSTHSILTFNGDLATWVQSKLCHHHQHSSDIHSLGLHLVLNRMWEGQAVYGIIHKSEILLSTSKKTSEEIYQFSVTSKETRPSSTKSNDFHNLCYFLNLTVSSLNSFALQTIMHLHHRVLFPYFDFFCQYLPHIMVFKNLWKIS